MPRIASSYRPRVTQTDTPTQSHSLTPTQAHHRRRGDPVSTNGGAAKEEEEEEEDPRSPKSFTHPNTWEKNLHLRLPEGGWEEEGRHGLIFWGAGRGRTPQSKPEQVVWFGSFLLRSFVAFLAFSAPLLPPNLSIATRSVPYLHYASRPPTDIDGLRRR